MVILAHKLHSLHSLKLKLKHSVKLPSNCFGGHSDSIGEVLDLLNSLTLSYSSY